VQQAGTVRHPPRHPGSFPVCFRRISGKGPMKKVEG